MLGGIFLCAALYFLLQLLPALLPAWIFLVVLLGFLASLTVPAAIQRRLVYPRSGYVVYKEATPAGAWRPLFLALGSALLMAVAFYLVLVYDTDHAFAWVAVILAFFLGLVWIIANLSFKIRRLNILGAFSLLLGILISPPVLGSGFTRGEEIGGILLGAYFLLMGGAFFVSGGLALRNFLRDSPPPAEAPDVR
jgi:hypothetical protein